MPNNGWTPERRSRMAELIKRWKPWEKSTGPKTPGGKAKVGRNSRKHGMRGKAYREEMRKLKRALADSDSAINEMQGRLK